MMGELSDEHGEVESILEIISKEEAITILSKLNSTHSELACKIMDRWMPKHVGGCNYSFDKLMCWPSTAANSTAELPCLAEINGVEYNTSHNASRWCDMNGTWASYTDYNSCREVPAMVIEPSVEITTTIYFTGYTLSLVALALAIWIFIYFKDLRCLRNVIHTNLMCTYILTDFMWILTLILQMFVQTNMTSCVFLIILLHYFHLTNFFWMFVEGLYLYMLVVETFTGENIKLRVYAAIGWGIPMFFVILWAIVKSFAPDEDTQTDSDHIKCPWMKAHNYDWIYQAPAIGILLINLIFLFVIMWVLITKLRSAHTVETQQYRKASKALLVLIPLLGITYILTIAGPTHGVYRNIYENMRAILISTQGFTVALFYCFLNTEVQNTMRHHLDRWKTARSLSGSRRYNYSTHSKDWSPRSRTESIRLYSQPTNLYRKRESTASETTTTTLVNVNGGGSRVSNGSQVRGGSFLLAGAANENAV